MKSSPPKFLAADKRRNLRLIHLSLEGFAANACAKSKCAWIDPKGSGGLTITAVVVNSSMDTTYYVRFDSAPHTHLEFTVPPL